MNDRTDSSVPRIDPASGCPFQSWAGQQVVNEILGGVVQAVDLLQHLLIRLLPLEYSEKERMADQIPDDIDGQREILGKHAGVIAGQLAPGKGV